MEVHANGDAKRIQLVAATKADANALITPLAADLRTTFAGGKTWSLEVDITRLGKSPSLAQLKVLARTLDELRPAMVRHLQHTTIVCSTKLQRVLIALVFTIHRPATPISVVAQRAPNSCATVKA